MNNLERFLKENNVINLTNKVKLVNNDIMKSIYQGSNRVYNYLKSQKVESVIMPKEIKTFDDNEYYIFPFYEQYDYPSSKKLEELKIALQELHTRTSVQKTLKRNNLKFFYRIYYKLDIKFKMLELYAREAETRMPKNDNDWITLSKYSIFLDAKKELYKLQRTIHGLIDGKESAIFALNHGIPHLDHLVDKRLISLDNAKIGIIVSDIAKVYVLNEYISIDWFSYIDNWLSQYEGEIYKKHFKFLVIYLFILNIHLGDIDRYQTQNDYIQISSKIKKFMFLFSSY